MRQLHEPYPPVLDERDAAGRTVSVGEAVVRITGNVVSIRAFGPRPIDLLRAGASAIWGSGLAIYGLDVPARDMRLTKDVAFPPGDLVVTWTP